jgi:CRP-like cAMP-binding protein
MQSIADFFREGSTFREVNAVKVEEILSVGKNLSFFQQIPPNVRRRFVRAMILESHDPETVLFREGDMGSSFSIILSGSVAVFASPAESVGHVDERAVSRPYTPVFTRPGSRRSRSSRPSTANSLLSVLTSASQMGGETDKTDYICTLGSGDCYGNNSLLEGAPRTASLICVDKCEIGTLSRKAYDEVIRSLTPWSIDYNIGLVTDILTSSASNRSQVQLEMLRHIVSSSKLLQTIARRTQLTVAQHLVCNVVPNGAPLIEQGSTGSYAYWVIAGSIGEHRVTDLTRDDMIRSAAMRKADKALKKKAQLKKGIVVDEYEPEEGDMSREQLTEGRGYNGDDVVARFGECTRLICPGDYFGYSEEHEGLSFSSYVARESSILARIHINKLRDLFSTVSKDVENKALLDDILRVMPGARKEKQIDRLAQSVMHIKFFQLQSDSRRAKLVRQFRRTTVKRGQIIYNQGEEGERLYFVLSGSLSIHVKNKEELERDEDQNPISSSPLNSPTASEDSKKFTFQKTKQKTRNRDKEEDSGVILFKSVDDVADISAAFGTCFNVVTGGEAFGDRCLNSSDPLPSSVIARQVCV